MMIPEGHALAPRSNMQGSNPLAGLSTHGFLKHLGPPSGYYFPVATASGSNSPPEIASRFMTENSLALGMTSPRITLTVHKTTPFDIATFVHQVQHIDTFPVFGSSVILKVTPEPGIRYLQTRLLRDNEIESVLTSPRLSCETATEIAEESLLEKQPTNGSLTSYCRLTILAPRLLKIGGPPALAWHIQLLSTPIGHLNQSVFVDAISGEIPLTYSELRPALDREIFDSANIVDFTGTLERAEGDQPSGIAEVDNAYDSLGDAYSYFLAEHGRDSLDDSGHTLVTRVRYCDSAFPCPLDNAAYDPGRLFGLFGVEFLIGDGYAHLDDIIGHEYVHGVTDFESGLIYLNESGAINESLSDIWGEFIDLDNGSGNDSPAVRWIIGEDLATSDGIRSLSDPPNPPDTPCNFPACFSGDRPRQPDRYGHPTHWYIGTLNNGGVHINSGVGNKLAYLLTDGDSFNGYSTFGVGASKVADLFYHVQVNLLGSSSDYGDLYAALVQAATDLGWTQAERDNLEAASRAVEIHHGLIDISPIQLFQDNWTDIRVEVVAPETTDYYVRVWDSSGVLGPDWDWAGTDSSIVSLLQGSTFFFNLSTRPDSPTADVEFWLYKRIAGAIFWPIDTLEVTLTATTDSVPPVVQSHTPGSGDIALASTNITAVFSEEVQPGTVQSGNVSVTGSASGSHSTVLYYDEALRQLTIDPSLDFTNGETVTVSLSSVISDLAGNGLDGDGDGTPGPSYQFSFDVAPADAPTPPANLSAVATSATEIDLTWLDQSGDEDGFEIQRRIGSGLWSLLASLGPDVESYVDPGLTAGTPYTYRVRAFNVHGFSAFSNEASATPQEAATAPDPPSSLQATTVSSSRINLTWADNSNDESGFKIERRDGASGSWFLVKTVSANVTFWQSWGLDDDTTYSYRVQSYNTAGISAFSNVASATTESNAPNAPSNLLAWVITSTRIGLSWTDRSSNENGFEIERRTEPGGSWAVTGYTGRDDTTFEDFVNANTEYSFRVRAHNSEGYSGYSNVAAVTSCAAPREPFLDEPHGGADGLPTSLTLEWENDDEDASYDVYLGTDASPPFFASIVNDPDANGMALDVDGLSEGTFYYWRVLAHAACDPSLTTSSPIRIFSTLGAPGPVMLLKPADGATGVATDTVLDWQNVTSDGPTLYDLYLGTTDPPPFFEAMGTRTEKLVTGLAVQTTHYWKVVAKSADDPTLTSESDIWEFTTGSSGSTTLTFEAIQDAGLRGGAFANTNYGGDPGGAAEQKAFGTGNDDNFYQVPGNESLRGLVEFDLTSIPDGSIVTNATLTLEYAGGSGSASGPLTMHFDPLTSSWSEATVTWNNRPGLNIAHQMTGTFPLSGFNPTQNDLTTLAQKWIDETLPNHGIQISIPVWESATFKARYFYQKEWSPSLAAELSVTYTEPCLAPPAPTSPVPADGAIDQAETVTLDWADVAGASNFNVYFGATPSPSFHALVTASELQVAGLNAASTYYWQVEALADCDLGTKTLSPVWSFITESCFAPDPPALVAPAQLAADLLSRRNAELGSRGRCRRLRGLRRYRQPADGPAGHDAGYLVRHHRISEHDVFLEDQGHRLV